jgi:glutamine synthetase
VPSSQSIAGPNIVLNTIVADVLSQMADRLEKAEDFNAELKKLLKEIAMTHARIIFDGNNYSEEWVEEAERRGLLNIRSTVEAIPAWVSEKAVALFEKHGVLSPTELHSRYEICLEQYSKSINIEAQTMLYMVKRQILPAGLKYVNHLASGVQTLKGISSSLPVSVQEGILNKVSSILLSLSQNLATLEEKAQKAQDLHQDAYEQGKYYRDDVFQAMATLRQDVDQLEEWVDGEFWPLPTYAEMLFKL